MCEIRSAGEDAVLLELPDQAAAHRVWAALRRAGLPGVLDLVVGARTVLVVGAPGTDFVPVRAIAAGADSESLLPSRVVRIPVEYDGADLADVAARTELSVPDVVRIHSGREYMVAFLGFAPGFPYMTGLSANLRLPRRDSPRTRVPAGSVAIAGEYTAVYPSPSPGGWHLLGHTDIRLFDDGALLQPGDRVRFVPR